jgi:hypothetical protein
MVRRSHTCTETSPGIMVLEIGWYLAGAFMVEAAMTVSPPGFLDIGCNRNHDVVSGFRHFGELLSLITLMRNVIRLYDKFLSPEAFSTDDVISRRLLAALTCAATKFRTSVRARTVGDSGS